MSDDAHPALGERTSEGGPSSLIDLEGADALIIEINSRAYLERSIALGHMAALLALQQWVHSRRLAETPSMARTAAAEHLRDYGHQLDFGCCRPPRREGP